MTYKLTFSPKEKKKWNKLGDTIKNQFKKKLLERLENPYVPADQLSGFYRKALSIYNKITLPLYKVRCFFISFSSTLSRKLQKSFFGAWLIPANVGLTRHYSILLIPYNPQKNS